MTGDQLQQVLLGRSEQRLRDAREAYLAARRRRRDSEIAYAEARATFDAACRASGDALDACLDALEAVDLERDAGGTA